MNRDNEESDPLPSAIAEFRKELLEWIDTEYARVLAREREWTDRFAVAQEQAAARESAFNASSQRGLSLGSSTRPARIAREEPGTRETVVDQHSVVDTAGPPAAVSERPIDAEPQPTPANPRQRLEALARLLDRRLKQAQGAAAASDGAGKGPKTGMENDAPSASNWDSPG